MHEWVKRLKDSIAQEHVDAPAILTLATLSRNGSPRARSVVCRDIDDDGAIWMVSDARSKKNEQIKRHRRIEAVLWLPKLRRQFRIRGEARVVDASDPRAIELWRKLSDATRAMFTWPAPGDVCAEMCKFATALSATRQPPPTFEAIALHARMVEQLDLAPHPHQRLCWRRKNGWQLVRLNP